MKTQWFILSAVILLASPLIASTSGEDAHAVEPAAEEAADSAEAVDELRSNESREGGSEELINAADPLDDSVSTSRACTFHSDCVEYCYWYYGPWAEAACIGGTCHCSIP